MYNPCQSCATDTQRHGNSKLRNLWLLASAVLTFWALRTSVSVTQNTIASSLHIYESHGLHAPYSNKSHSSSCLSPFSDSNSTSSSLVLRYWKSGNLSIQALLDHAQHKPLYKDESIYALGFHHNGSIFVRRQSHRDFPADLEKNRRRIMEAFWIQVLQFLHSYHHTQQHYSSSRWCHLRKVLFGTNLHKTATDTILPSIPIRFRYTDYNGCVDNLRGPPVPTFSNARSLSCDHGLVLPNYSMVKFAQTTRQRARWKLRYRALRYGPWQRKIPKAVWRGTITGNSKHVDRNVRWNLCTLASSTGNNSMIRQWLDVKPTAIQKSNYQLLSRTGTLNTTHVPTHNLRQHRMPMEHFQAYQAVLDIDGNSWSSRFPNLLCLRTIVLKVEPEDVDSLYNTGHLQAWKHYIPVSRSLQDLEERLRWIFDPHNYGQIQAILAATHQWCIDHFVLHPALIHDTLDIWNDYVALLEKGDADWQTAWNHMVTDQQPRDSSSWDTIIQV